MDIAAFIMAWFVGAYITFQELTYGEEEYIRHLNLWEKVAIALWPITWIVLICIGLKMCIMRFFSK